MGAGCGGKRAVRVPRAPRRVARRGARARAAAALPPQPCTLVTHFQRFLPVSEHRSQHESTCKKREPLEVGGGRWEAAWARQGFRGEGATHLQHKIGYLLCLAVGNATKRARAQ